MSMVLNWLKRIFTTTTPEPQFELTGDDIVVFVVGPTGSGKSTFVRAVTDAHDLIEVGRTLQTQTKTVQAIRCEPTAEARKALGAGERENIVFVDTPSFLTEPDATKKAVSEMTTWLEESKSKCTRVGTIYLHRVEDDPDADKAYHIQEQLDTFSRTFPPYFIRQASLGRLRCIFSLVDNINKEKRENHQKKFQGQIEHLKPTKFYSKGLPPVAWSPSTHLDLFEKGDPDVAWKAVVALFSPTKSE